MSSDLKTSAYRGGFSYKILLDSVHSTITLDNVLFRIIDTPEFQRMRNIKQLETIIYLYPSACHTRFEHSIGTCHLAGMFVEHLQKEQPEMEIDNRDVLCVKIAGLCHDLGHGPFSHMFEEVIKRIHLANAPHGANKPTKKFFEHEKVSLLIFERIFDKLHDCAEFKKANLNTQDREFIKELIKPTIVPKMAQYYNELKANDTNKRIKKTLERKISDLNKELLSKCGRSKEKAFLTEIVSNWRNQIDVDKWDYFARDALNLGIKITFDPIRYIFNCRIINPDNSLNQICVREKELRNVYEMFRTREDLYRRAYQHSKCIGIKEMMIDILILLEPINKFYDIAGNLPKNLDRYLELDDRIIVITKNYLNERFFLTECERKGIEKAKWILTRLETRSHYKCLIRCIIDDDFDHKITTNEVMKRILLSFNGKIQNDDIIIVELKVNFGNGNRDPLEKLNFFEKTNFNIVKKECIPEYQSKMKPKIFQEIYWNLYLKNEKLLENRELILELTTLFKEICSDN